MVLQNIERIRERYSLFRIDPFSALAPADLDFLALNIQKRHVIGHNLGISDEHYFQIAQNEQPGETVSLLGDEIARFADACAVVIGGLEAWLLPNASLADANDNQS